MIGLLLKNPYMVIGAVLAVLLFIGGVYTKGYLEGKERCMVKNTEVAIELKEKQDEIRARRPDVPAVTHSLQQHRF